MLLPRRPVVSAAAAAWWCRPSRVMVARRRRRASRPPRCPAIRCGLATTITRSNNDDRERRKQQPPSTLVTPGLLLSAGTAAGGLAAASVLSSTVGVPVSGIPCSILLGMSIRNTIGYQHDTFQPGITFATKTVLQSGIVCVAAKLSVTEVLSTGSNSVPVVLGSVGAGLLFVPYASRLAGLPRQMGLLLTAGTSICGVTAITALAPAIAAPPRDVAVAVANTVAFGTLGMLCYPYLLHAYCGNASSELVGLCLGTAIHDTSQVLGAALSYKETYDDEVAFQTAAVTKLVRNLGLAVAIPALTYAHYQQQSHDDPPSDGTSAAPADAKDKPTVISGLPTFSKYVPPFLIAFLAMSVLRSTGDMMLMADTSTSVITTATPPYNFTTVMNYLGNDMSKYLLGTAMAGVGLSTSAKSLQGVGWKPFAVGGTGALVVGGTGLMVASWVV